MQQLVQAVWYTLPCPPCFDTVVPFCSLQVHGAISTCTKIQTLHLTVTLDSHQSAKSSQQTTEVLLATATRALLSPRSLSPKSPEVRSVLVCLSFGVRIYSTRDAHCSGSFQDFALPCGYPVLHTLSRTGQELHLGLARPRCKHHDCPTCPRFCAAIVRCALSRLG